MIDLGSLWRVVVLMVMIYGVASISGKLYLRAGWPRVYIWIGVTVHEFSHMMAAWLTLSPTSKLQVSSRGGSVSVGKSRLSFIPLFQTLIASPLIALAPLIIGTILSWLLASWVLNAVNLDLMDFSNLSGIWENAELISMSWQFWVALVLGTTISFTFTPSSRDWKNIWGGVALYILAHLVPAFLPYLEKVDDAFVRFLESSLAIVVLALIVNVLVLVMSRVTRRLQG